MYTVIKTDDFGLIQSVVQERLRRGEELDLEVSQKGDIIRVEMNTVEYGEDET